MFNMFSPPRPRLAFSANAGMNGCRAPGEENWLEIDKHICDEVRMRQ